MECYIYLIENEQEVIGKGCLYATNSIGAIQKFQKEVLPKFEHYTYVEFKEASCSNCHTTHGVVALKTMDGIEFVCRSCDYDRNTKKKATYAGTQIA